MLTCSDRDVHAARKRVIRNTFTTQSMRRIEPRIQAAVIAPFVAQLGRQPTCDIYALFHFLLFDMVGHVAFSRDFGLVRTGDHPIVRWLREAQRYGILQYQFPAIRPVGAWFGRSSYDSLIQFTQAIIRQRQAEAPQQDILQDFLDARETQPISDAEIAAEMVTQVIAGTDTTANTLTWTLKLLLDNPAEMERVVAELDAAFPSPDDIHAEAVKERCPYLDAVLHESMRLFPVGAGHLGRVVPAGGAEFEGYHLPEGTECGVTSFAYHRSAQIWKDPDAFLPARFLGPGAAVAKAQFLPFLAGPRSCTGREMAWMAMDLALANLLRRFRVTWHDPRLSVTHCYFLVLKPKESAMLVHVAPRS